MDFPASTGYSRAFNYYPWQDGTSSNSNGRLAESVLTEGSVERVKLAYDYDSFGNVIELTDTTIVTSTTAVVTEPMTYDF